MKKAFTLVELLVSIAIIATLTAILLPNFMGARERAKDSQKIMDANALKNALRLYYNDNQAYPTSQPGKPLGAGMGVYTNSTDVGYTYDSTSDSFSICVPLDSGQGDDDINSQIKCNSTCGQGNIGAVDKLYVVCAK